MSDTVYHHLPPNVAMRERLAQREPYRGKTSPTDAVRAERDHSRSVKEGIRKYIRNRHVRG